MCTPRSEHTCVFGLGWGDEGKGKVVDLLCAGFDFVVRYNGGANAGHTVRVGDETFALHLLPSGVLHENVLGVIGPGVVVDPLTLIGEIDELAGRGLDATSALRISDRAHLVLKYHKVEDQVSEQAAPQAGRIGTTIRGIGPCYADKMKRTTSVRFSDLLNDEKLEERVRGIVTGRKVLLNAMYGDDGGLRADEIIDDLQTARDRLAGNICDTTALLQEGMDAGKGILFEGANGMLLDVDHGTYPFVTSSSPGPHGTGGGAGVPAGRVPITIGVSKAYATRVGSGPFVSELNDATGDRIRERGNEFGTTTGRPRRCGWFDAVTCRYSARIGDATDIALMHLDTLSGFEQVGLCVAYRIDGETVSAPPGSTERLQRAEPVLEFMQGWHEDLSGIRHYEDLPRVARDYVERIETLVELPASIISVGPERSQTLVRDRIRKLVKMPETSLS